MAAMSVSSNTPIRAKTPGIGHISSKGSDAEANAKRYRHEARDYVNERLWLDFEGLIELAAPADGKLRKRADSVAAQIADDFENTLALEHTLASNCALFDWIRAGAEIGLEKDLYGHFDAFMHFVAEGVRRSSRGLEVDILGPKRTIEAYEKHDVAVDGSKQNYRLDIFVECRSIDSGDELELKPKSPKPRYGRMFTVVEAKKTNSLIEVQNACIQLIVYMRQAYVAQLNRCFVWGITLCGDAVRVCSFGNDHMLASREMRLTEKEGRARLIKYLVYWSFCEVHRLGYDPTIKWLPEPECWQIEVPVLPETDGQSSSARTALFYTSECLVSADHLFGRHTRVFLATNITPTHAEDTKYDKCRYVIKDSWVEVAPATDEDEDMRDEIRHLRKIRDKLEGHNDVAGCYPTIVAGGRVQIDRSDGKGIVDDTTASMLGDIFSRFFAPQESCNSQENSSCVRDPRMIPFRAHKRVVTTPIGKPLRHLNCPLKLVKVITDVMRTHYRIRWDAEILHRDVSINNLLFYETDDGSDVRGLLIDFDHAVDLSVPKTKRHLDRSGTLPFMSINNLNGQVDFVTGLDDWESVLYVLCWISTYGFNASHGQDPAVYGNLFIRKWYEDSLSDITMAKQLHLNYESQFSLLTKQFLHDLPYIEDLEDLVHALRTAMFENPDLGSEFHGTVAKYSGPRKNGIEIDPFKNRMTKERELMESLLQVLEQFFDKKSELQMS
ncbi:hypothetical protein IW150_003543 [Coemansia sp. RSA 2607]|nr:hypothetical protein IW150_003543 [Coemansia sp. RSA 2607]